MIVETRARAAAKAFVYRVVAAAATTVGARFITGQWRFALGIGLFDLVVKTGLFYVYERFWTRVPFGRRQLVLPVVWLTGMSGAGKSTLGKALATRLEKKGFRVQVLDGDEIRALLPETGFSRAERENQVKRVALLANYLQRNGICVIACLISPYREGRERARRLCRDFFEVHVATPIEECARRDPKGIYARARRGELKEITGIDAAYEPPLAAELTLDTTGEAVEQSVERLWQALEARLEGRGTRPIAIASPPRARGVA